MKVWVDGTLQDVDKATVSVLDHGLTVGDGVFETLKAVDGRAFATARHLARLARSAKLVPAQGPGEIGICGSLGHKNRADVRCPHAPRRCAEMPPDRIFHNEDAGA